ncbi:MAG: ABC transporter permease [Immundisolibacterales bacterium]|nr:ABC transporter permease [Immundisolibacterales bacterium]
MTDRFRGSWLERLLTNPLGLAGTVILLVAAAQVALGPALAPYDPLEFHPRNRLEGPSLAFWFGTDQFGRDVFSRVMVGARSTILFGVVATVLSTAAGSLVGIVSGYVGGRIDDVIMRATDSFMAIPNLLLAMLIITVLGPSTTNAVLAVAVSFTPSMARIARSVTLSVRTRDFVHAAVARGEGAAYIVLREILPNVVAPVVIESSIRIAFAIMIGATLSFLGLGAQPPASDWGLMVSEARSFMFRNPWLVVWPSLAIGSVAIGFNLFGDGLRDALNPRVGR